MNVNFNIIFNVSVLSGNFGIVELQNTLLLCLLFLGLIIFNNINNKIKIYLILFFNINY